MKKRKSRELLNSRETLKYEILATPINRLGLKLKGTFIEEAARRVREDIARLDITQLNPSFYVSNSYGCMVGTSKIGVGFYDCNDLLQELNKEFRGFYHDPADILQILRHEVGHAFCYAYKLYRSKKFRSMFNVRGHFFNTYPEHSGPKPNPWSADYVNPTGDFYAQKHPDEDFAETFSVFVTPGLDWRQQFGGKPGALEKLAYVEKVVSDFGRKEPPVVNGGSGAYDVPVEQMSMTVAQFLGAKPSQTKSYRRKATGYVDGDLRELFQGRPRAMPARRFHREYHRASRFLRDYKRLLVNRVSYWVHVDEAVVADLVDKLVLRCRATERFLKDADREKKVIEVTSYLSVVCRNYRETEQYFRPAH